MDPRLAARRRPAGSRRPPFDNLRHSMRAILLDDKQLTHIAIASGVLTLLCMAAQWILARRALCPLCMTPVLANKLCAKHRNARKLLGSHRLRVAVSVLTKGTFTCPYCYEASEMEVRHRRR